MAPSSARRVRMAASVVVQTGRELPGEHSLCLAQGLRAV